jgi:hypothetical protein
MNKRHLTAIYYFAYVGSLSVVILFVYLIMDRIETATTLIETKIRNRDIVDVIDNEYKLDLVTVKPDESLFLNELTDFFFEYHQNSKRFRTKLSRFGDYRQRVLHRFNQSKIQHFDMSTPIPRLYPSFVMDFSLYPEATVRSVAFTQAVRMQGYPSKSFPRRRYFICSGRVAITSFDDAQIEVQIRDLAEAEDSAVFMKYYLIRNEDYIVNLNRLMSLKGNRKVDITVQIKSHVAIKINKSEVSCTLLEDVA